MINHNYDNKTLGPKGIFLKTLICFLLVLTSTSGYSSQKTLVDIDNSPQVWNPADTGRYHQILDWVYQTMDQQYYAEVSPHILEEFKIEFPAKKMYALNLKNQKTEDFVHLGAGLLVNKLRDPQDRFSTIVPPKKVEAFKENAYAEKKDLGIQGFLFPFGFEITHVQKHSQAFSKNLRMNDVITQINGRSILNMNEDAILDLLHPEIGTSTQLSGYRPDGTLFNIEVLSESYFIETVKVLPVDRNDILALHISQFNQKTAKDFAEILSSFGPRNIRHLILDLRDNQGGPPLAAKEMMGFMSPVNDPLFLVVRKNKKPFLLTSDKEAIRYEGPVSILVNGQTASAAETLAGILREKDRAILYGQKTNGASYLKSLYDYEDGSSLMLVTSRTFFHNLKVFPTEGLVPDVIIPEDLDAFEQVLSTL